MRIIISSGFLVSVLNQIDFLDGEYIQEVELMESGRHVRFITDCKTLEPINVHVDPKLFPKGPLKFNQDCCRWDSAQNALSKIEDQPIILIIENKTLNIILQYGCSK